MQSAHLVKLPGNRAAAEAGNELPAHGGAKLGALGLREVPRGNRFVCRLLRRLWNALFSCQSLVCRRRRRRLLLLLPGCRTLGLFWLRILWWCHPGRAPELGRYF